MTNSNRQAKGAIIAGAAVGGQFAQSTRSQAEETAFDSTSRANPAALTSAGQQVYRARVAENMAMMDYVSAAAMEIHPEVRALIVQQNDEWDECYTLDVRGDGAVALNSDGEQIELDEGQSGRLSDILYSVNLDKQLTRGISRLPEQEDLFELKLTDPSGSSDEQVSVSTGFGSGSPFNGLEGRSSSGRVSLIKAALTEHIQQHPDDAHAILDAAAGAIQAAAPKYPEVLVRPRQYSSEIGWIEGSVINPLTGRDDTLIAVDSSTRETELDDEGINDKQGVIHFEYGGSGDYNGVMYLTASDRMPVRLPEGWTEQ